MVRARIIARASRSSSNVSPSRSKARFQAGRAILRKLLGPQRAVEAKHDVAQKQQQQLRAREALRGVFGLVCRRLQQLLVERADVMLGRFEALPAVGSMVGVHD